MTHPRYKNIKLNNFRFKELLQRHPLYQELSTNKYL